MRKQRLMGAAMVLLSGLALALAAMGTTLEERDATAVLLTLPLGLYMLFTNTYILYDGPQPRARDRPKHLASPPRIYIRSIKSHGQKGAAHGKKKSY